jgi:hypothetical protein
MINFQLNHHKIIFMSKIVRFEFKADMNYGSTKVTTKLVKVVFSLFYFILPITATTTAVAAKRNPDPNFNLVNKYSKNDILLTELIKA